jgi:hypothetical protein
MLVFSVEITVILFTEYWRLTPKKVRRRKEVRVVPTIGSPELYSWECQNNQTCCGGKNCCLSHFSY